MNTLVRLGLGLGMLVTLFACELVGSNESFQTIPDPAPLPDTLSQAYREDARQLAVRRLVDEESERVEIPDTLVDRFYNALGHVYNARDIPARDSIIGIHTFPRYNLREIIVGVDSSTAWAQAWQNGERWTGNDAVDALLEQYDLSLKDYLDFAPAAVLRAATPLNPVALSSKFEGIAGVRYAEQNGYAGDGNNIRAEPHEGTLLLHYSRAWGDCIAGCIHRKTWTFRVQANGVVSFEGKTSD